MNALCPGIFETEMTENLTKTEQGKQFIAGTPAKRFGELPELDFPLLLLAGEGGSYINGTTLVVDGGHTNSSL